MRISLLLLIAIFSTLCQAQSPLDNYLGGWSGQFTKENAFKFNLVLSNKDQDHYQLQFKGNDSVSSMILASSDDGVYRGQNNYIKVELMVVESPVLFIQVGNQLCNVSLEKNNEKWSGSWNLLIAEEFNPTLYMSIDKGDFGYSASTFFKEPSLHYMLGENFESYDRDFGFRDIRSRIMFRGKLKNDQILLTLNFLNEKSELSMQRLDYSLWDRGSFAPLNKNLDVAKNSKFKKLIDAIHSDTLERTHSVVIMQNDKIILEKYFDGFSQSTPHDTRSAAKSIAGAIIGLAMEDNILENEETLIKKYFENKYSAIHWDHGKDAIQIHHLLTMSSGIDAIDFGLNRNSYANEGTFRNKPDWTKHILSAPMVKEVGLEGNYGSGSPQLLGTILAAQLKEPLEFYMHRKLFQPLGIKEYRIQMTNEDIPYFGGGWYHTPMDLVKFGSLYVNEGKWKGKQIIPASWIQKSLKKHVTLENAFDKNKYGYFFWHKTYQIGEHDIESIEARGTGGQYLFIVHELNLVAAITSGNYANNKGFQPERIFRDYILGELVN